jgi:hypothetical protein
VDAAARSRRELPDDPTDSSARAGSTFLAENYTGLPLT